MQTYHPALISLTALQQALREQAAYASLSEERIRRAHVVFEEKPDGIRFHIRGQNSAFEIEAHVSLHPHGESEPVETVVSITLFRAPGTCTIASPKGTYFASITQQEIAEEAAHWPNGPNRLVTPPRPPQPPSP